MSLLDDPRLARVSFPQEQRWETKELPVVVLDGQTHFFRKLPAALTGTSAYVVGLSESQWETVADRLDVEYLRFYEMRVADLTRLARIERLRHLAIEWNTKLQTLEPLRQMLGLQTLMLIDTAKVRDISPVADLSELKAIEYSGGMWKSNRANSLEPLSRLPNLRELRMFNVRVLEGGLRPLAKCPSLDWLEIDNHFETSDYAYLSVALPHVQGGRLAPWIEVDTSKGDRLIMGKGKPILDSKSQAAEIARYEREFQTLREKFRAELGAS